MAYGGPQSRLFYLSRIEKAVVVEMGQVGFVSFNTTQAIGTGGLGSCSVVVIASQHGAILAHIPPRPDPTSTDPYAGDNNVRRMMAEVKRQHDHYKSLNYFPGGDTVLVCAWFSGALALPDQLRIMHDSWRELGYDPVVRTYNVPVGRSTPGFGTVLVDSEIRTAGGKPTIYVEDNPL